MPKVVLDRREAALWLRGRGEGPDPNVVRCNSVPYGESHDNWVREVTDVINTLAGHMGGFGVDVVDEEGNDLSLPLVPDAQFSYAPPDRAYSAAVGTDYIHLSDVKDS